MQHGNMSESNRLSIGLITSYQERWAGQGCSGINNLISVVLQNKYRMQHELGSCFYSSKHQLAYIHIPRNGSTTIKDALGWQYYNNVQMIYDNDFTIKKFIVVLRDPVERWEGTMAMLLPNGVYGNDEHLLPQQHFVHPFKSLLNDIVFFYLTEETNILVDISNYFDIELDTSIFKNKSIPLIKVINDSFIQEYYSSDMKLLARVNFANKY